MRDAIVAASILAWYAGAGAFALWRLRRTVRESLELLAELVHGEGRP